MDIIPAFQEFLNQASLSLMSTAGTDQENAETLTAFFEKASVFFSFLQLAFERDEILISEFSEITEKFEMLRKVSAIGFKTVIAELRRLKADLEVLRRSCNEQLPAVSAEIAEKMYGKFMEIQENMARIQNEKLNSIWKVNMEKSEENNLLKDKLEMKDVIIAELEEKLKINIQKIETLEKEKTGMQETIANLEKEKAENSQKIEDLEKIHHVIQEIDELLDKEILEQIPENVRESFQNRNSEESENSEQKTDNTNEKKLKKKLFFVSRIIKFFKEKENAKILKKEEKKQKKQKRDAKIKQILQDNLKLRDEKKSLQHSFNEVLKSFSRLSKNFKNSEQKKMK